MTTLSRGCVCSYCGNSAEDENGHMTVFAADCTDPQCVNVSEVGHWHMTYARIACNDCAEKVKAQNA